MKIGVIQVSSQTDKNGILYDAAKQYAKEHEIVNFGCFCGEDKKYSYIEISIEIGLLLVSKAVDFIVTGCSSGQGMMLACNSIPGVICGYAPSPMDAYFVACEACRPAQAGYGSPKDFHTCSHRLTTEMQFLCLWVRIIHILAVITAGKR